MIDEKQIRDKSAFEKETAGECKVPIFIEKGLDSHWKSAKIHVTGWSSFKRFTLVQE